MLQACLEIQVNISHVMHFCSARMGTVKCIFFLTPSFSLHERVITFFTLCPLYESVVQSQVENSVWRVDAIVIDVSPLSWIQAFSICLHKSAPLPSDSWLRLVLHITHCVCQWSAIDRCCSLRCWTAYGGGARCEYAAPFSCESSASDAWLWQLTILTWAFHPLSDHTMGDRMASHLWRPTNTSLHQSKYHMLSTKNMHVSLLELQSQRSGTYKDSKFWS